MNAIAGFASGAGTVRSVHESPRSVDRNRRFAATRAHTTVPLGASRSAKVGRETGSIVGLGVADRPAATVGGALAGGSVVDDVGATAGCAAHAASSTATTRPRRITPARSRGSAAPRRGCGPPG